MTELTESILTTEQFALTCEVCGQKAKPGKTETQARRNLGLHKRTAHGIPGKRPPYVPKWKRAMRKKQNTKPEPTPSQEHAKERSPVLAIKLPECPCCGARFYAAR